MADQVYNLTQTGAEVQAIINDANNAKGAGATTSLSTDYIMLKDTSGQYHKIQKESFTEAVRNTLASLLVNNDKGTTISQIAAIASGDFGSVTPANLASVLGGGVSWRQVTIAAGDSLEIPAPNYSPVVLKEATVEGANAIFLVEYSANVFTAVKSPKFEQVFSITKTAGAHISVTNITDRDVTAYYKNL